MRNRTNIGLLVVSFLGMGSCLPKYEQQVERQEELRIKTEQRIEQQLEMWTAEGYFPLIAAYTHQQIDQHPDQYRNELYTGAEIALRHAPNAVYFLAAQQYEEDMREDMESLIYALQNTKDNGFSYNRDLDYDE